MIRPIIPTCTDRLVLACLESMERSEPGSASACIVGDNGLTVRLQDRFPGITVVRVPTDPFIHMRALNIMVAAAKLEDDIVVMGDDTTILSDRWISCSQALIDQWPSDIGMMNYFHNQYRGLGDYFSWLSDHGWGTAEPFRSLWTLPLVGSVIPRRMINRVGPFDERFVGYGWDDIDWCVRLLHAGLHVAIVGNVSMSHLERGTYAKQPGHSIDPETHVNRILFCLKWGLTTDLEWSGFPGAKPHFNRASCTCGRRDRL